MNSAAIKTAGTVAFVAAVLGISAWSIVSTHTKIVDGNCVATGTEGRTVSRVRHIDTVYTCADGSVIKY